MQRINLFPNPVFAGPLTDISHWGATNGTVRDNALHVTGQNGGYGFNVTVPFNVPLVLSMRVNASEDNVAGMMIIQTTDKPEINNMLSSQRFKRGISDVLHRFTVTSHGFRLEVNPNGIRDVAVSNVLIERADTYDIAVGGGFRASSRGTRCRSPDPLGGGGMSLITNLYPDSSCYKQLGSWQSSGGVNVEHLPDGRYRYTNTGGEDRRGRQPQHLLPWRGQFDVGGLGRVRGRRMADRPTTPPPVPVVRRRLDAPAVIGGERR